MVDLVEDRADREVVVVVVEMGDCYDVPDRAALDEEARGAPGRGPASVLVDRDLQSQPLTLRDELAGCLQVGGERLLRKHVLPRGQSLPDECRTHVRMRRDVHDLDVRMAQELVELSEHVLDANRSRIPTVASGRTS